MVDCRLGIQTDGKPDTLLLQINLATGGSEYLRKSQNTYYYSTHCSSSHRAAPCFCSVLRGCQEVEQAALADVIAVRERDPACTAYSSALLYYKGYHALQTHRIAHGLWERGQTVLARSLQVKPLGEQGVALLGIALEAAPVMLYRLVGLEHHLLPCIPPPEWPYGHLSSSTNQCGACCNKHHAVGRSTAAWCT